MDTTAPPLPDTPAAPTIAAPALVLVADPATTTTTVARLDAEARFRLRAVLDEADYADYEEALLRLAREAVDEDCPGREAVGVRFTTTLRSDGWYLSPDGDVLFADGGTDSLDFGDDVDDTLTSMAGRRHADYSLAVDLRNGSVFDGDNLVHQTLAEVFAYPPTGPRADPAGPGDDTERRLGMVLSAVRHARVIAEMELVAHVVRRSWPQALSLRLDYVLSHDPDPVIDSVRLAEVHGPDGLLWDRSQHVWGGTPEVVSRERLGRVDSHLTGVMPDARSFGHELRWAEVGDTVTAPLPPL